jgi:nucleoid DNA-binding protein
MKSEKLNGSQLIELWAAKTGQPLSQVRSQYDTLLAVIYEHLKKGRKIALPGLGLLSVKKLRSRIGVNPRNPSQKITIPETSHLKLAQSETAKKHIG